MIVCSPIEDKMRQSSCRSASLYNIIISLPHFTICHIDHAKRQRKTPLAGGLQRLCESRKLPLCVFDRCRQHDWSIDGYFESHIPEPGKLRKTFGAYVLHSTFNHCYMHSPTPTLMDTVPELWLKLFVKSMPAPVVVLTFLKSTLYPK
jgi:hypothetical protein